MIYEKKLWFFKQEIETKEIQIKQHLLNLDITDKQRYDLEFEIS